jgi:hypothetical protein
VSKVDPAKGGGCGHVESGNVQSDEQVFESLEQAFLTRFPKIVFLFDNEFDDEAANEQPAASKPKARGARKR